MVITAISPQKHDDKRFSVFVDGEFVFGMSGEDILYYHLSEHMTITQERLDYLMNQVIVIKAQETALRYIAHQPRTRREVVRRLREADFSETVIARVLAQLTRYKYVDDTQYAQSYVASRLRGGRYGLTRIRAELKRKGLSDEIIREAVAQASEDNAYDEVSAVQAWLLRKRIDIRPMNPAQKKRCTAALLRGGFSYAAIQEVYRQAAEADYEN